MGVQIEKVIYSKSSLKFLMRSDEKTRNMVRTGINDCLKTIPPSGDVKPIKGCTDGKKRLRLGKIRVIFMYIKIDGETAISIYDIGYRGDIYK